jgi:tRNA threonylcarbamoyl adenosine modification protein YeaZ
MIGENDNGDLILGISTSSNSGSIAWIDIFEQKIIHAESWQAVRPHTQKNTTAETADASQSSATTDTRPWTHTAALPSIFAKKRHLLSRTLRVAVGLGPGSHSGIRAAIVAARALELTREIPLYGVCCHDAIALAFKETEEFCVITDAGRDMAALSRYHRDRRTDGPRLATWQEAQHIALTTTTIASHPLAQMPQIRVVPPDAIHTARAHIAARHSGQHPLPIESITLHQTNFKKLPTAQ